MSLKLLRMGTRGSPLARAQSGQVADAVTAATGIPVEMVLVRTEGDRLSTEGRAPQGADQTGIFTRALDDALREGRIDFAVHSLKDVPTEPQSEAYLAAVPRRADSRDALVVASRHVAVDTIQGLPKGACVATSSPRRVSQLLRLRRDLKTVPMAGNVDTRLKKLEEGAADALLLASAGLDRLGLGERITRRLDPHEFLSAPAQGALALVCRTHDGATRSALSTLDDADAHATAETERWLLHALRGGCRAPVAANATLSDGILSLIGRVLSLDGQASVEQVGSQAFGVRAPEALGRKVAEALLAKGAGELISRARA